MSLYTIAIKLSVITISFISEFDIYFFIKIPLVPIICNSVPKLIAILLEYVKIINDLSKKTGLKVITFEKRKKNNYNNILRCAYTDGPEEFVRLIKNAQYVVTTSFHATVFSIIFHKKLFVVPHNTTGSRMLDLLNKLGLKDRAFYTLEEFQKSNYDTEIDYKKVEEILELERNKSLDFLKRALKNSKDDKNE